jgi:hypothetical protein
MKYARKLKKIVQVTGPIFLKRRCSSQNWNKLTKAENAVQTIHRMAKDFLMRILASSNIAYTGVSNSEKQWQNSVD